VKRALIARTLIGGLVLAVSGSCAAFAQGGAPSALPRPDVKAVQDWQVRCYPVQSISPCDIFQEQAEPNSGQRILSISLAFVPSMNRHIIQVTVPLDVSIPEGVTLQSDNYTSPLLKYRMCTREGCFVQTAMDNAVVEQLSRSSGTGKVNVVANGGKKFALNFSLKGFAAAHDDMASQAKAKAAKPAEGGSAPAPAAPATP
jgi:invasion protein IalB